MNLKYILIVVIALISGVVKAQTYESYADSVDLYAKKQDWKSAEIMIKKALNMEPANYNTFILLSNLGTIHRNMGRLSEALADYNAALSITPNAVAILHNRASLCLEMDSLSRAYSDYARIMVLDKKDVLSRYYHGMIALGYGQFDIAKADFDSALQIDKNSIDAKRGLAVYYKINNDFQRSVEYYTEVLKSENVFSNYLGRAESYLGMGKLKEADQDIIEAQKLEPTSPDLYLLKAQWAKAQYRYDDASDYAKEAVRLGADPKLAEKFYRKKE